jgi:DNA-binding NarL/FixJ family response regulator
MQLIDSPPNAIRILVADGHPIFRQGLIKLLETRPNLTVVGAANDGDEALALVKNVEADVLLLDMQMPRMQGMAALREMESLGLAIRTLIVTATIDRTDLIASLALGARGVVLKESASDVLFKSIQAVMSGEYWVGRKAVPTLDIALKEAGALFPAPTQKPFGLTPREREIVGVILTGCSNSHIAAKFSISEKTVKHHLTNIFDKLGVSSRLELALFALHHKLVAPAEQTVARRPLNVPWTAAKPALRQTS